MRMDGDCLLLCTDLQLIHANMPSYRPNMSCDDTVRWVLTTDDVFTLKSAWNGLRGYIYGGLAQFGLA